MKNSEELRQQLRSINRKSYPAYKGLKGLYHFGNYILSIDHVQGDPFASPSHVSIQISHRPFGFCCHPCSDIGPLPCMAQVLLNANNYAFIIVSQFIFFISLP